MKAAFIDPQLRVLYYPTYDILAASDRVDESEDDVPDDD